MLGLLSIVIHSSPMNRERSSRRFQLGQLHHTPILSNRNRSGVPNALIMASNFLLDMMEQRTRCMQAEERRQMNTGAGTIAIPELEDDPTQLISGAAQPRVPADTTPADTLERPDAVMVVNPRGSCLRRNPSASSTQRNLPCSCESKVN